MNKLGEKNNISIDFDSIKNVRGVVTFLLFKKNKHWTIGVIIFSIVLIIMFRTFYGLIVLLFYYLYLHIIATKWFMKEFAKANGMEYQEKLSMESVKGELFKTGNSRGIRHVISTKYKDHPLRLFHYTYSVGSGKNRTTYNFTVTEIFFKEVEFPHILLQSRTMWKYGASHKNQEKLSLEEEFEKNYYLYSVDGYEVEVFQIFTKEFLRFLKEKGPNFSIEFASNRLYIYDNVAITNKADLIEIYDVTKEVFDSIGPLLNRLHDDFASLHPYYKK